MSDQRVETHVVVADPETGRQRAIHFQEWWVRHRAALEPRRSSRSGSTTRRRRRGGGGVRRAPTPSCSRRATRWCRSARSSAVPGLRDALLAPGAGRRRLADRGRRRRARDGRPLPARPRRRGQRRGVGRHYGARAAGGLLDAWLVHPVDAGRRAGRRRPQVPLLLMSVPRGDHRPGPRRPGRRRCLSLTAGPPGGSRSSRSRAARVRSRRRPRRRRSPAPRRGCADGDVVVVTSKVVSKVEGRLVQVPPRRRPGAVAPADDRGRGRPRRSPAAGRWRSCRPGRAAVMAAAGIDASNVAQDALVLLPEDGDASARGPAGRAARAARRGRRGRRERHLRADLARGAHRRRRRRRGHRRPDRPPGRGRRLRQPAGDDPDGAGRRTRRGGRPGEGQARPASRSR